MSRGRGDHRAIRADFELNAFLERNQFPRGQAVDIDFAMRVFYVKKGAYE